MRCRRRVAVITVAGSIAAGLAVTEMPAAGLAGSLLAVRGLRLQAQGDPAAFPHDLVRGFTLTRNLRNRAPSLPAVVAASVDGRLLDGLDRWLENLDGRPDLLRRTQALLREHATQPLTPNSETFHADYVVARNTLDSYPRWLPVLAGHIKSRPARRGPARRRRTRSPAAAPAG